MAEGAERDAAVFRECLAYVRARAAGPVEGLYTPDSLIWRVNREVGLLAGGSRALLLQLAHPAVAEAVHQSAGFRHDLLGRARRTFSFVYALIYGDLETALGAATQVHLVHSRVQGVIRRETSRRLAGQPYRANDPALLLWVYATLLDTTLLVYERLFGLLTDPERDAFYDQARLFAVVMGVPPERVPSTLGDFRRYFGQVVAEELEVGATAWMLRDELFLPFWRLNPMDRWLTAGTLPAGLREAFGLAWGAREQRLAALYWRALRLFFNHLPAALRYPPAYHQGLSRVARARRRRLPLGSRLVVRLDSLVPLPLRLAERSA